MKKDKKEKPVTPETPGLDQDIDDGAMDAEVVSEAGVEEQTAEASVAEWQAALELAVKQRDELKDQFLRAQADFQNFKRRNQTARSDGYDDGVREVIAAMLPAIDNLERAIEAAEKHEGGKVTLPEGKVIPAQEGWDGTTQIEDLRRATSAMAEGVQMTLNSLLESLKRFGFEEVPALGEEFDPEKHNAVMREVGDEPGKVLEVFQKGYKVKDRIIRYAMVKVAVEE